MMPNKVAKIHLYLFRLTLAWKIPWMEEPGRLQSMGWPRVGHLPGCACWGGQTPQALSAPGSTRV